MSKAIPIRAPDDPPTTPTKPSIKASTPAFVPTAATLAVASSQSPKASNLNPFNNQNHNQSSSNNLNIEAKSSPSGFAPTAPVFIPKSSTNVTPIQSPLKNSYHQPQLSDYDQQSSQHDQPVWDWQGLNNELQSMYNESYLPRSTFPRQPLQYHLYVPPPPFKMTNNINLTSFFMNSDLHTSITDKHETSLKAPPPGLRLPERLHVYRELYPLDDCTGPSIGLGGFPTFTYRATSERDGSRWCLRRVEGFRLTSQEPLSVIDRWKRIKHPNVVSIIEAFSSKAFNDSSLILSYAYYPNSNTLFSLHSANPLNPSPPPVSEKLMWTYLLQLVSGIMHIHDQGLAVRCLHPSRILVTGKNRIRINCIGALDILVYDEFANVSNQQQEDFIALGTLILILALGNSNAVTFNPSKAMEYFSRQYSPELQRIVLLLLGPMHPQKNAHDLWELLTKCNPKHVNNTIDASLAANDKLEYELSKEVENGRLVRLLCKFGFINERAEFDYDPRWSETGDRYIIKLFRDYVFHQVDENGKPVLDMSHVLVCLNKLDVGVDENILLISRDEQSCLVVSYKEVKHCIESAFSDLKRSQM